MQQSSKGKKILAVMCALILCLTLTVPAAQTKARKDMTQGIWTRRGSTVTVKTGTRTRKYTLYNQLKCKGRDQLYYRNCGCVTTAVSIAASGFNMKAEPWIIHTGKTSSLRSESRALSQLKQKRKKKAISLRLASQILTNMKIRNKRVMSFTAASAEKEIRAHLLSGKPVIVKVRKGERGGVKFTNNHHTLVLLGITGDYVVFANPATGSLNNSRVGTVRSAINMRLSRLVRDFMFSSTKGTEGAYVTSLSNGGGYILVG